MAVTEYGRAVALPSGAILTIADPSREYLSLKRELDENILGFLAAGKYVEDKQTAALEEEFAAFCGVKYAVNTASGTMAMVVGLKALGIGPGDEVITAPYTCTSTTSAIALAGGMVRFTDLNDDTLTLNPELLEKAISPKTRAILPVHMHGQVAEMNAIGQIAGRHDLVVLEDAALSVGAKYHGRCTGGLGHAGAFSFAPSKVLGGLGWGGMVTTNDPEVAARARQLAGHGPEEPNVYPVDMGKVRTIAGYNAQLNGIQAAGLRVKLRHVEKWVAKRRQVAARYDELCDRLGLGRNRPAPRTEPSYRAYIIRVRKRDEALKKLHALGIKAFPYFVPPLHLHPIHAGLGYQPGDFPVAERATDELLALPVHPFLTKEEINYLIAALEYLGTDEHRLLA